nr:N-6 DNA methylase [Anoxybacter fermentans]
MKKIVNVFDEKKEIPKYSRLVDIKEIEENDFNLNIRRYVDNTPEPEIEDVHAHLVESVPKREVELYRDQFKKFGISHEIFFKKKDESYLEFKEEIRKKEKIKEIIENSQEVKTTCKKLDESLKEWWEEIKLEIEDFYRNNHLWEFRNKALKRIKEKLLPVGVLDEFKIAGIFVNWWEDLRYDFKTIVSVGWSANLIEDERIKNKFFSKEVKEIEELEGKIAEIEGEINEIFEEIEEWDEEEQGNKTIKKVKDYLKELVKDLRSNQSEAVQKEASIWENLIKKIDEKDKKLKKLKKELKTKAEELEGVWKSPEKGKPKELIKKGKIHIKRESFTEEEAKELILEKFYDLIAKEVEKYVNAEKKKVIKVIEKLWDKYKIPLNQIEQEREEEVKKLNKFLTRLGYYDGRY